MVFFSKQKTAYKGVTLLLVIGLFWANLMAPIFPEFTPAMEQLELYDPLDAESEKEKNEGEKDLEDKVQSSKNTLNSAIYSYTSNFFRIVIFSIFPPEIQLPPPEYLLFDLISLC